MAKKQTSVAVNVLSSAQKSEAVAFFTENAATHARGAPRWAAIRAMFITAGVVDKDLKAELATINRKVWVEKARADKGTELTVDEIDRIKKIANADFSRGVRDPNAKPKTRGAQTNSVTSNNGNGATKNDGSVPHSVLMADTLKRLAVRATGMEASLVQYQQLSRLPKQVVAAFGDLAENVAKLIEDIRHGQNVLDGKIDITPEQKPLADALLSATAQ